MQTVDVRLEDGALALGLDGGVDLLLGLGDHFLDAGGMDAAVLNELFERDARDFTPHGVEARERDGLGRVVDDEVAAGERLDGADVAALAADDAALHLVVRQRLSASSLYWASISLTMSACSCTTSSFRLLMRKALASSTV